MPSTNQTEKIAHPGAATASVTLTSSAGFPTRAQPRIRAKAAEEAVKSTIAGETHPSFTSGGAVRPETALDAPAGVGDGSGLIPSFDSPRRYLDAGTIPSLGGDRDGLRANIV